MDDASSTTSAQTIVGALAGAQRSVMRSRTAS